MDSLNNWKNFNELIPENYKQNSQKKRTGISGILAACLELTREGVINIMQNITVDSRGYDRCVGKSIRSVS